MKPYILGFLALTGMLMAKAADVWLQFYVNDTPLLDYVRPSLNWYGLLSQFTGFMFAIGLIFIASLASHLFNVHHAEKIAKAEQFDRELQFKPRKVVEK